MRFVPWLFVMAIGGACALPSYDEFSSGTADAGTSTPSNEAGPDREVPGLVDAGEASIVEGQDASSPPLICPDGTQYCEDFSSRKPDEVGVLGEDNDGQLEVIDEVLHSSLPALPESGFHSAELIHFLPNKTKTTVEIDLNLSASPANWGGGNMLVFALAFEGQPNRHAFELYLNGDSSSLTTTENNGQLIYDGTSKDLPRARWVRVKIEGDITPGNGSVRVSYDNEVVAVRNGIDFGPLTGMSVTVRVGLRRNNAPTPALTALYDNLVVTQP